jgi:alanyl-tRNA synthetase
MMKKAIIAAGISAVLLFGGGFYNTHNAHAAAPAKVEAKANKAAVLSKYKDQLLQLKQLRQERHNLKKQLVQKRHQLSDLLLKAKNSQNNAKLTQAKAVQKQIKTLKAQIKPLVKIQREELRGVKAALKSGNDPTQFNHLIATSQQINTKMKNIVTKLDNLIKVLN